MSRICATSFIETCLRNARENEDEECSGYMFEIPGSPRCPVTTFLTYKSVLHPALDCLWQRPKATAPAEGPWHMNSPVGVNLLGNKMKEISEAAGCSKIYTNHCLRATTVTVLDRAGFAIAILCLLQDTDLKLHISITCQPVMSVRNR